MSSVAQSDEPAEPPTCILYVVNLFDEPGKFAAIKERLNDAPWIDVVRIEAVPGSTLPDNVAYKLTRDPYSIKAKGALGCFLSHLRIWELIAASRHEWAFVVEDDAHLSNIHCLRNFQYPPSVDLIFVNDRMQPRDSEIDLRSDRARFIFSEIVESLLRVDARRQAVGTDGYLISRSGALKLIAATKTDLYFGHIDMRLLAYSIPKDQRYATRASNDSWLLREVCQIWTACSSDLQLHAIVASPPLTLHEPRATTSRTKEDSRGTSGASPNEFM